MSGYHHQPPTTGQAEVLIALARRTGALSWVVADLHADGIRKCRAASRPRV